MTDGLPCMVLPMGGLGDTIYQRPFLRLLAEERGEVFVRTPWPEFFVDCPGVKPTFPHSIGLRTQEKNAARHGLWHQGPVRYDPVVVRYFLKERGVSILEELARCFGMEDRAVRFDLPEFGPPPVTSRKPIAVVRPVTLRTEWLNPARAPSPEYVAHAAKWLRQAGYHVVSVADVDGEQEWLVPPAPLAHQYFVRGELAVPDLMSLVQSASVVVGGVGWIVPAAIAAGTPLVVIAGGQGGYNAPEIVTDPRMDTSRVQWIVPDDYCPCRERTHDCPKEITDFETRWAEAMDVLTSRRAA